MKLDRILPKNLRYVRKCELLDNGKFIIHCQFEDQSKLLAESRVLYVDKTFKRTACNELEFNSYDKGTGRITTLARIYTDLEDRQAYCQAFRSLFEVTERDIGRPIQLDHLTSHPDHVHVRTRTTLSGLVKVCRVHYNRSIIGERKSLKSKGVPAGK
jgi:hypothetical protein